MMKTLYITDLDGTFLNNDGLVSQKSVDTINKLIEKGLLFSVATARSLMTVREIIKDIKISDPLVLMSGVFIFDINANKPIKYFKIDNNIFYDLMKIYDRHEKAPFVTFYNTSSNFILKYTDLKLQIHKDFYNSRSKMPGYHMNKVDMVRAEENEEPIFISLCDTYEDLLPITKELDMFTNIAYSFYKDTYTPYWFLEVFNGEASKAKGLSIVKEYLNADKVVAFGDNLNDLPLFSAADEGYAVSNAVIELKKAATAVIESNEENGVAQFIEADFNKSLSNC